MCEEIFVIDSFSKDRTVELVKEQQERKFTKILGKTMRHSSTGG
ncbi:MAG: hypothetical protein ACLUVG_01955 [Phocaeicola vulgatus]